MLGLKCTELKRYADRQRSEEEPEQDGDWKRQPEKNMFSKR
jgi:hypothetical protein